nr:MAG TPA: hypothetical protein [Caudoviricetes sp.]
MSGKVVEKSGNAWYNELKSEGNLPYKFGICIVERKVSKI